MRVRAILNPRAGTRSRRALAALENGPAAWSIEIATTNSPGHARDLARESAARGDDLVLAVGGDGTVNETAAGLLGSHTTLGIVPAGSGNGLARTLGIARDARRALAQLATGVRRRIDVGRINGELFLNVAGTGFDAVMAAAFHDWGKPGRRRGILPYAWLGIRELARFTPDVWQFEADGQRIELPIFLASFANGRQYGGGAIIAPRAMLDDGFLEVAVIEPCGRAELALVAPRLFLGNIDGFRHYRRWRVSTATLTGRCPTDHHRDGEPGPRTERYVITVEPRALDVLVPRATVDDPRGPFVAPRDGHESAASRPNASAIG